MSRRIQLTEFLIYLATVLGFKLSVFDFPFSVLRQVLLHRLGKYLAVVFAGAGRDAGVKGILPQLARRRDKLSVFRGFAP